MKAQTLRQHQKGGAEMGAGKHGRTFDVGRCIDDRHTLYEIIRTKHLDAHSGGKNVWTLYLDDQSQVECKTRGEQLAVLKTIERSKGHLAKTFLGASNRSAADAFQMELGIRARVIEAYGGLPGALQFTTLHSGLNYGKKMLVGIQVHNDEEPDAFYMISTKCDVALDKYPFKDTDEVLEMATDLLDSFEKLHAGNLLHADVKLDNMVHCSGQGRRFRLIDWGGSMSIDKLTRQYLASKEPRNTASPMAWYTWGMGIDLTVKAFYIIHARMYPSSFFGSIEFFRFCASSLASFVREIQKEQRRPVLLRRHAKSFDLYNLGLTLAHLAVTTVNTPSDSKSILMSIARRLTHYSDPNYGVLQPRIQLP